ncbi:MAG: NTP transferase domain-containing protein [Candidatus Palauibacterales bacterium]|nr:NTP transferase domain-containing protein [Candidatus Palauibacterales bacterium]MDP2529947.1 NTP transferase domain-containing protein [Candidatus Palauibacterales bacterium]MDP2583367.1 NTP transferase domain-containing protein [Candidatus Palauibacterales bacterium]
MSLADRPDAMVFAAGLGTRLRPLTERLPKALVEVGGEPALGHVLRRLAEVGAGRIVVNAHPFADRVEAYLREISPKLRTGGAGPGPLLLLSREPERPLETGGGLLRAAPLFNGDRPVLVHNVDVLTGLDLGALLAAHRGSGALATLAVQDRPSSRRLLFDETGLMGREDEPVREARGEVVARAFAGVHVASAELPGILGEAAGAIEVQAERGDEHTREGGGSDPVFSIVDAYLELAARGASIRPHDVTGAPWFEIGTPERLEQARSAVEAGRI